MTATKPVTIRLPYDDYLLYEIQAEAKGQKISTYLRSLLTAHKHDQHYLLTHLDHELKQINSLVTGLETNFMEQQSRLAYSNEAALLEILLLLRAVSKPETVRHVQHQLIQADLQPLKIK